MKEDKVKEIVAREIALALKKFEQKQGYLKEYSFIPGSITNRLIKSIRWDKGQGGSLTLGGLGDVSGVLSLLDENSSEIILMDKRGLALSDGTDDRILLSSDGEFKISIVGNDVRTAADANLLMRVGDNTFIRLGEFAFPLHSGERQWTENNTWTNIKTSDFEIDGDSFQFTSVYFSVLGCVETGGRTAYYRIYDVTDSAAVASSEITTTAVSSDGEDWVNAEIITSSALTFDSGAHLYRLQFKQSVTGGAGDTTQFFKGQLFYAQG